MYENMCAICGQPIIGYWHEIEKNHICQSCAASTTVYDLYMRDLIAIKPDIIDSDAALVTKDGEELKAEMTVKVIEENSGADNATYDELIIDGIDYNLPADEFVEKYANNPDALRHYKELMNDSL